MNSEKVSGGIFGIGKSAKIAFLLLALLTALSVNGLAQTVESIVSDRVESESKLDEKSKNDVYAQGSIGFESPLSQVAQASSYFFSTTTSGSLVDMSTGTTTLVAANTDDSPASPLTNIGFDFYFQGVRYSQFSVNANGVLRLGATAQSSTPYQPLAQAGLPIISAYGADQRTHTTGKVHFKVTGAPGSRVLVIEWLNMQSNFNTGGTADLTYQVSLHETTGSIEFVYGSMTMSTLGAADANSNDPQIGFSSSNSAGTVGSVTAPQDGMTTPSFDGGSAVPTNNLYTAGAISVLSSAADGVRRTFSFTPPVPNAPSGLNFTGVTASSITLNWTDNSSNEDLFAIYRSTDGGMSYSFLATAAEDAVTYVDGAGFPGTNYTYQVFAVSEGALSSALTGSQATNPPGNDSCAGAGGSWSAPATWTDGSVPTATDNVTIGTGCTVTVDVTNAVALNVTIDSGGTLQSPTTGTVTNNNLTVSENVTNNGTLDFSTNGNTSAAILTFGSGSNNVTFGGSGAVTDVRSITVAKGAQSRIVELNPTNFTVQGVDTDSAGFLTLTSGTFKISGTFAVTNRIFTAAGYTIPALGGIWLNNPNFVVAGQNGSPTNSGLFRITQGTYNIGTGSGNSMGFSSNSSTIVEGGAINASGRFGVASATNAINYTQSAGLITVQTVGNTSTTLAGFDLGTSTSSTINMNGGTVAVQLANTAASGPRDYRNQAGSGITGVTGGILQLGNASSGAAKAFTIRGVVPNLVVDNTSASHSAQWDTTLTNYNNISLNITTNTGTSLNLNNAVFLFAGSTLTNNGTLTHNGASSRFITFSSTSAQSFTGSGTVTAPMTSFEFQSDLGFTFDSGISNIITNRVINFVGNVINSNKLTVGNGGATTATIQIGNTTTPTAAGTFDSQLVFNPGTGGINVSYLRTSASRVTGGEIPATRSIGNLNYDDNDPTHTLTITGGDLTSSGTLSLTNGTIVTGANNLIHNGTAARTNGFVDGNLSRSYTATGAYTYHVGQNGYSPVLATVSTLTTNPSSLTVSPSDNTLPGLTGAVSASRFWNLTENGDLTADLAFTYLDGDVNGNETDYRVYKLAGGVLTNQCAGGPCVNDLTNTATVTGVSDFSAWGIGEAAASAPGIFDFSAAAYSVNENGGTATITVNRTTGSAATITVNRTNGSANSVTVDYATVAGGSATSGAACTAGVDYVDASGTLTFANGETSKTFSITVCDESDFEPDETVNLALSNATGGATIGMQNTSVLTILNDDMMPPANVNVNPGNANYATLKEAFDAINAGTHTGAVTVDILGSTTETASAVLNSSGAGSASYTSVVIRPAADGVAISGASVQGRGLIELNGADNVTIDGDNPNSAGTNRDLTIHNAASNTVTFTSVIRIAMNTTTVNSADNNVFKNLNIVGNATGRNISTETSTGSSANTTFGILAGANASGETTAPATITSVTTTVGTGATAANLLISNNSFATLGRGVSINGSATTVFPGVKVQDNTIGNPTAGDLDQVYNHGIYAQGTSDGLISGNTIYVEGYIGSSGSSATAGINVGTSSANSTFTIEKNKVLRSRNNNEQSWATQGINLGGGNNHIVQNNFVSDVKNSQVAGTSAFSTTFGVFGIRVGSGTGHKVYHNSVNLYGLLPGVVNTDLTAAFAVVGTGQTGVDVRNNIFVNTLTGGNPTGTRNVAVYVPTGGTSAMNLTLNNNDYFVGSDAQNRLAQRGTTFGTGEFTLADFDPMDTANPLNFRSYSSTLSAAGTNDNAGKKVDPLFVSNTDLHIDGMSPMLGMGAGVSVVDDIDGEMRPMVPDIGADEIAAVAVPGTLEFSSATYSGPENSMATITVSRTGGSDGAVTVDYASTDDTATGGASCGGSVDYVSASGTLSFADGETSKTFDVSLCADISTEGDETVNLGLSNATGGATIGAQNAAVLTINDVPVTLSGTYTVGSGGDYASLTNAGGIFEALNTFGASGNITIEIISDLSGENGTVALNEIAGGFSVLIKPSAVIRPEGAIGYTISGASTSAIIRLNGADNVTIDGSFSGGTAGDTIGGDSMLRNLTVQNTNVAVANEAVISVQTGTNGAQNVTIKNVNILGQDPVETLIGIAVGGNTVGTSGADNDNVRIENCSFRRSFIGVYNAGTSAANQNTGNVVAKNDLTGTGADRLRRAGMLFFNHDGLEVSLNDIAGIDTNESIDTYGIGLGTQAVSTTVTTSGSVTNSLVTRNRITGVVSSSTVGFSAFGIGVAGGTTGPNTISNNMISGVTAPSTSPDLVSGIFVTGVTGSDTRVYHNSISLTGDRGAVASQIGSYGIAITGATPVVDLKNNIFYNTQTSGGGANARSYSIGMVATTFANFNSNYNDFFASGPNASFFRTGSLASTGGTQYATLALFSAATSSDANSQEVDPLFVSTTNDLHLQGSSPVANDGIPVAAVTIDIDGEARSMTTPDIGADEFVSMVQPGTLQFSSATYSGSENGSPFVVTVTRTGGSDGSVSVDYATSNGSATGGASCTPGVDYINNSGTLTFADGVTSQTFSVSICDDSVDEPNETINYALTNATGGATIGTPDTAVQTIVDDDPAGSFAVNDVRLTEGNSGTVNATFTVTFTGSGTASIDYATANGTATSGVDYSATSGTLNFGMISANTPSGIPTETQTVSVVVNGDTLKEQNETFYFNLSNPVNATITDNQGVAIIVDEDRAYVSDFDNDKKADYTVFRPSTGVWYVYQSTNGLPKITVHGSTGDIAVPGDYDGDGVADVALFRPSDGNWYVIGSVGKILTVTHWGLSGDIPVQGDYDGDGKTDQAVFRPSDGVWYILRSSNGSSTASQFGIATDKPVVGDFDGDFKNDYTVFRDGVWYSLLSSNGSVSISNWGSAGDIPVAGDFDGDGSNDRAIYRDGDWWINYSLTGGYAVIHWGVSTDVPAPADFDGDGTTDLAIFRPSEGNWYMLRSSNQTFNVIKWGLDGDVPAPSAYNAQP